MVKFIVLVIAAVLTLELTACDFGKIETVLGDASEIVIVNDDISTNESKKDFEEFILGKSNKTEEKMYDLDVQVAKFATTEIIGTYNKNSTSVTCKVTAPDVYSYLMNNMDLIEQLEIEELYQNILLYIQNEECDKRTVEIEVPAELQGNKLVIDTTYPKYQDAVNGGMNSALTEIYVLWLLEVEGKEE